MVALLHNGVRIAAHTKKNRNSYFTSFSIYPFSGRSFALCLLCMESFIPTRRPYSCLRNACFALNSECWTQTEDVHGLGGVSQGLTTVFECQAACISDITCVAVDWEPTNAGQSCWILTSAVIRNTTTTGVITHYELHRVCPS